VAVMTLIHVVVTTLLSGLLLVVSVLLASMPG
jgi:hypothetical protein